MDDIRRPNPQRREFAMRHRQNYNPPPAAPAQPAVPAMPPVQPAAPPAPEPYAEPAPQPPAPAEPAYQHYTTPAARPEAAKKPRRTPAIPLKFAAGGVIILLLFGFGGYYLTRPAKKSGFTVAELSKKSTFGFYYPSPLPAGYSFDPKFNAFQDGQAYFMLANGSKHLIFREQSGSKLNASSLTASKTVSTPSGPAAIGTVAGQPAAKVVAGSTLVTINTTGNVPAADVAQAVNTLKAAQ